MSSLPGCSQAVSSSSISVDRQHEPSEHQVEPSEVQAADMNDVAQAVAAAKTEAANQRFRSHELQSAEDLLTLSMQQFHLKYQPDVYSPKIEFHLESNEELQWGPVSLSLLF